MLNETPEPLHEIKDGGFYVRVWAKSEAEGVTLTTVEARYPRFIHSEVLTHRDFSRNAASSRAIPIAKMMEAVELDPVIPIHWGSNQPGMQAGGEIGEGAKDYAKRALNNNIKSALVCARALGELGLHKQIVNRVLEPYMWMTSIISSTRWANFFALRNHPDAEPHFQKLASMLHTVISEVKAEKLEPDQWHLPLVTKKEVQQLGVQARWVSAGRCARVSYLTHDGKRDTQADIDLAKRLAEHVPPHASPLEHPARVAYHKDTYNYGNFDRPFLQLRKQIPNEYVKG